MYSRTCGRDDQQGAELSKFVVDVLKKKGLQCFMTRQLMGRGYQRSLKKSAGNKIEVVVSEGVIRVSGL